jgi:hypothetical protein
LARYHKGCDGSKVLGAKSAISEQLSLLEKETRIEEGFFIQPLDAARGSIFRQRSFVEVVRPGESFDDGEFGCAKGDFLLFLLGVSCCRQHTGGKD